MGIRIPQNNHLYISFLSRPNYQLSLYLQRLDRKEARSRQKWLSLSSSRHTLLKPAGSVGMTILQERERKKEIERKK